MPAAGKIPAHQGSPNAGANTPTATAKASPSSNSPRNAMIGYDTVSADGHAIFNKRPTRFALKNTQ
jgi:hypothetical protein